MDLTLNQRFCASALADRLIYGDESTFDLEDAVELLAVISSPSLWQRVRASLPSVGAKGNLPGQSFNAVGAGGLGGVKLTDDRRDFEFDTRGSRVFRAGQWKLARTEGLLATLAGHTRLELTQVMGDAESEQSVVLKFKRGVPQVMKRYVPTPLELGPVTITVSFLRCWKTPAPKTSHFG